MSVALDVGAHAFRTLRQTARRLVARRSRSVAAILRDDPVARDWLGRLELPCVECDRHLLVPGDAADDLARLEEQLNAIRESLHMATVRARGQGANGADPGTRERKPL